MKTCNAPIPCYCEHLCQEETSLNCPYYGNCQFQRPLENYLWTYHLNVLSYQYYPVCNCYLKEHSSVKITCPVHG